MGRKKEQMNTVMKTRVVPVYYDRACKVIFSENRDVLIKFLSELLHRNIDSNAKIIIGKEAVGKYINGKTFRHDMIISINDKEFICFEMNANKYAYSINRNFIYLIDYLLSKLPKNIKVADLNDYRVELLNLNMFGNASNEVLEEATLEYSHSKRKATEMIKIIDFNIAKCYDMMYNEDVEKSKIIRWGSIFKAETIEEISDLLGDDLLTMEEKERFLNSIRAVNGDEEIVAAYRNERNERWKRESIENGLREEGKEENTISIIKNMLSEKIDYNTISKVTGKTMEEIKEIENNM